MSSLKFLIACLAAILFTVFVLTLPVEGQVLYGSLVGNITDPSNAAVPGATVRLVNEQTGVS